MKRTSYAVFIFLSILLIATSAFAQQSKSRAEYDAYMAFYQEQNPPKKAELGEKFLIDYKESEFKPTAYQLVVDAYSRAQNWAKVMDAAQRFDANVQNADTRTKTFVYLNAMTAANQVSNFEKTVEYGDRLLALDPNNLNAQITLAQVIPERLPANEAEKNKALDKTYDLVTKAQAQVQKIFGQPKPAQLTEEQWTREKANIEGTLFATAGIVHLSRLEYDKAAVNYEEAIKRSPKNWVSHFRLGLSYRSMAVNQIKMLDEAVKAENDARAAKADQATLDELVAKREAIQNDAEAIQDKAIDALAKAVAVGGADARPAREQLERMYRVKHNDSLDGIEDLINKMKGQVG